MVLPPLTLPLVAHLYGIAEETLHVYEAEGIISPLKAGGVAYYTKKDRLRIEVILKGRRLGFSLGEIRAILEAHLPNGNPSPLGKEQIEKQIAQLEHEKVAIQAAIDRLKVRAVKDISE